ncbi:PASTA domain-containing protein [Sphingomonas sp. MAH-20]|uniref:PASTA domain-containing protein n=1 Tax=Sphingomonas horti TaxID=2682842 RepID=A0A6I4IXE4_9SPHN|nr:MULTISPECIES: PASTA domain-containing protein [Sphingomonas]MBA2920484.1 PASTA domain-containing protein [Sphingomonas sp. CGMCC 1.13658]MVO76736.1 PASTA domain-containing protein [Sphingomonas horti]
MPTFEIPDGPATVKVSGGDIADKQAPRTGSAVFNVTNKSPETRAGRLSVQVAGQTKREWFTIDGEQERNFAAGETQTANIKILVPPDVVAGDYPFRLRVVAVNDPDNDHADGPVTTAQVGKAVNGGGSKAWIWIVIALVVLAAIGAGLYFWLSPSPSPKPTPTPTVSPSPTPTEANTAPVPDLKGKTLDEAATLAQGFELVQVAGQPGGAQPKTIVSQSPEFGKTLTRGFPIKVTYDPGVEVPPLTGNTDQAVRTLSPIGLHVASSRSRCEATGTVGEIVDQNPKPHAMVASGGGVDIVIRSRGGFIGRMKFPCGIVMRGAFKASAIDATRLNR